MSVRARNWLKFTGLVGLAFALGLFFAGLLDLPQTTAAQQRGVAAALVPQRSASQRASLRAAQPLVDLSEAFAAVVDHVRPSVVYITSLRRNASTRRVPPGFEQFFQRQQPRVERGHGSGFIVSNDGYILTNNHVVEDADQVQVRLLDRREFTAQVIGTDPMTDVAVLKIDADHLTPASLGQSQEARVGEWVLAIGNPLGEGLAFTVTSGIVSAKGRGQLQLGDNSSGLGIQDFIQTDAAINPGNSGGPLVNMRGEVIGINSAIASQTGFNAGYGFAIPIDLAGHVMSQLISTGRVQRSVLGIGVQDATEEAAEYVDLDQIRGVVVQSFGDASPAERAGLKIGDVIVSIDGTRVDYTAQLQQMVGFRKPGEVVQVEVARKGGIRRTIPVRLMAQDPSQTVASNPQPDEGETASSTAESASIESLGMQIETLSTQWRRQLQLPASIEGVIVSSIAPGGPAERANLLPADRGVSPDIIVEVEDTAVRSESDLRKTLQNTSGVVALKVYNQGLNGGNGGRRVVYIRIAGP